MTNFKAGKTIVLQQEILGELVALLEEHGFTDKAKELTERVSEIQSNDRIRIAFIGQYSAGKSSIISALTNIDIPIGTDVTTESCTDYNWGNFLLTDTPGLQNSDEHDEIANEAINKADLIIYCITYELFNSYTKADYISLAYDKDYAKKMILVINKVNSEECDDRSVLISNYKETINRTLSPHSIEDVPYCFIDVLEYIKGVERNKERRIQKSNFETFIGILNDFLSSNSLICKLDTPFRAAKKIISDVMIDESETEEERSKRILISRLEREFQIMRATAERNWNTVVNNEILCFSEQAYRLFEDIMEGNVHDPESEYNALIFRSIESINKALMQLSEENNNECNEKANEILNTRVAISLFGDIGVDASEGLMAGQGSDHNGTGIVIAKSTVENVGKKVASKLASVSKDSVKKVILDVGHKFGHKFKPWGASKLAEKALKAFKFVGPAVETVGLLLDVKETIDETKAAKEQRKVRNEMFCILEETKKDIREECNKKKAEFIEAVFTSRLDELAGAKATMAADKQANKDFNNKLYVIDRRISEVQEMLFSTLETDNIENV